MKETEAKTKDIFMMHNEEIREMKHDKTELLKRIDNQSKKIIELEAEVARLRLYNSTDDPPSSNTVLLKYQEAIKKRDDQNNILQFQLNKLRNTYNDEINKYRVKLSKKSFNESKEENEHKRSGETFVKMKRQMFSRSGISGERLEDIEEKRETHTAPKTQAERNFIRYLFVALENIVYFVRNILVKQQFFRNLESEQVASLIDCAEKQAFCKGSEIIVQGTEGSTMFILISGSVQVLKNGLYITSMEAGALFGEVALLYNCMRTAQIEAENDVHVWSINRKHFQAAIRSAGHSKGLSTHPKNS